MPVVAQNNNNNSVPCTSTDDNKKYKYVPFRKISPGQHAALLKYLQTYSWEFILEEQDTQTAFDLFYECCYDFLNAFYPEKYVKIKSADPSYITPQTRSYTADAVLYRQPSGQPTNTVMLNLN